MRVVCVAVLCSLLAARALAQVRGVVRDERGGPVDEVFVELLSAGARLASTSTDAGGRFAFPRIAVPPVALVARKVGYQPTRIQLAAGVGELTVVLRARAVLLDPVAVSATGGHCVLRDDPEARRLWALAAHRYASGELAAGLWADRRTGAGVVPPESLGAIDTTRGGRGVIAGAGRRPGETRRERFYAQTPLFGTNRSYQWDYPWLESVQAWHFADPLFGELNRLALGPASDAGEILIEFCSQLGERPYIVGRLYLSRDLTLLKADWEFGTPPPAERAGAEVVFMPPAPGSPLLASSGRFWRRRSGGYYQEWSEFLQWFACEGTGGCQVRRPLGR